AEALRQGVDKIIGVESGRIPFLDAESIAGHHLNGMLNSMHRFSCWGGRQSRVYSGSGRRRQTGARRCSRDVIPERLLSALDQIGVERHHVVRVAVADKLALMQDERTLAELFD